jgi:single-strand DNA-binding protein
MASVNKIILMGNVGKDPELRYAPSGMAMCSVSLATSTKRKDKSSGEYVEETQWHRLNFFDKLAEIAGQYVKKGGQIYVEGRLKYGEYTDKDGVKRQTTDVLVSEMQLLGSREQGGAKPSPSQPAPKPTGSGFDDMSNSDYPF